MKRLIRPLLICTLLIPVVVHAEATNDSTSLFGITITQTVSEAEHQFELGHAYYSGDGVDQDLAKAIACYRRAAELGHPQAQFNLALCCMNGNGVEQSDKEAAQWFEMAARQGVIEALYPLGICHYNLENYTDAYAWALFAESQGDTRLKEMLDPMYSEEEIASGKARFEQLQKTMKPGKDAPENTTPIDKQESQ